MTIDAQKRREIRARYLKVDTANVADVMDTMGLMDQSLAPEFRQFTGKERLAGWAFTIRGQMVPGPLGGDEQKMQACQQVSEDEVTVWSGDGKGVCYFGELIALGMRERGAVGALIDGGIRDIHWLDAMNFPIFAKYRTPTQSIGRWRVTGFRETVYLAGATSLLVPISPGDFILADADGAIVIPAQHVQEVLIAAERLTAQEVQLRAELGKGLTLSDALAKYGHV